MPIFAGCSVSGSPGLSTLTLGLALTWPRPVILVEADPTGASAVLAGYYRGLRDDDGLVELMIASRQGQLAARLPELLVPVEGTQARLLVGTRAHEQSVGLALLWDDLLSEMRRLADTGQDVIVDAGRLGLDGFASPLLAGADVTMLATGSSLRQLAAAASWARTLQQKTIQGHYLGVVTIGEGRPYRSAEVAKALGLPALATVAWDRPAARVLSDGAAFPPASFGARLLRRDADRRKFEASQFLRSIRALGEAARSQAPPPDQTGHRRTSVRPWGVPVSQRRGEEPR